MVESTSGSETKVIEKFGSPVSRITDGVRVDEFANRESLPAQAPGTRQGWANDGGSIGGANLSDPLKIDPDSIAGPSGGLVVVADDGALMTLAIYRDGLPAVIATLDMAAAVVVATDLLAGVRVRLGRGGLNVHAKAMPTCRANSVGGNSLEAA